VAALCFLSLPNYPLDADEFVIPFDPIRKELPVDGKIIEEGRSPKNYFAYTLGKQVRGRGKHVVIGEAIGNAGIELQDDIIEINLGGHFEQEDEFRLVRPMVNLNVKATLQMTIDDDFEVKTWISKLSVEDDTPHAQDVEFLAKDRMKVQAKMLSRALGGRLLSQIKETMANETKKKNVVKTLKDEYRPEISKAGVRIVKGKSIPLNVTSHFVGDEELVGHARVLVGSREEGKQIEGFTLSFAQPIAGVTLEYMTHVGFAGDMNWVEGGIRSEGHGVQGFAIRLKGERADEYDVMYKAHLWTHSDTPWVRNGEYCGTKGLGGSVQGLIVRVVPKSTGS